MDNFTTSEIETSFAKKLGSRLLRQFGLRAKVSVRIEFDGWQARSLNDALVLFGHVHGVEIPDDKKTENQKLYYLCEEVDDLKDFIRPHGGAVTKSQMKATVDMMVEIGLVDEHQVDDFMEAYERKSKEIAAYYAAKGQPA